MRQCVYCEVESEPLKIMNACTQRLTQCTGMKKTYSEMALSSENYTKHTDASCGQNFRLVRDSGGQSPASHRGGSVSIRRQPM
jgi:hypothetical protein